MSVSTYSSHYKSKVLQHTTCVFTALDPQFYSEAWRPATKALSIINFLSFSFLFILLLDVLWPQCDENTTFSNHALYLGLPCCKEDFNSCPSIPSSLIFQRSTKETFWISTQLSSTKLTQNGTQLICSQCLSQLWIMSVKCAQLHKRIQDRYALRIMQIDDKRHEYHLTWSIE